MKQAALMQFGLSLLLAAALAGAYVFWYLAVERASADTAGILSELGAKEAARARTSAARAELAELASEEQFVRSHFVETADIVPFLERLEDAGDATVSVVSVSGEDDGGDAITVALSITGSFASVMRTLGAIEHGPYAILTENLTLSSAGEGQWTASGTFRIGTRDNKETP